MHDYSMSNIQQRVDNRHRIIYGKIRLRSVNINEIRDNMSRVYGRAELHFSEGAVDVIGYSMTNEIYCIFKINYSQHAFKWIDFWNYASLDDLQLNPELFS